MKKGLRLCGAISLFCVLSVLSACNPKVSLAKNIEGTWATNSEILAGIDALNASSVEMLQFIPTDGVSNPLSGDFTHSIIVDVATIAPQSDSVVQPYSVTVTAIASVQGSWSVIDDDEIRLTLDPKTFNVSVNPSEVVQEDNILTGKNFSVVDSIMPELSARIKRMITPVVQGRLNVNKIDDIHILKGTEMRCEINDRNYTFFMQ